MNITTKKMRRKGLQEQLTTALDNPAIVSTSKKEKG
jgi:hypothetical protein